MATPLIQTSLATGEISPSVWGRVDIDRERIASTTCRNLFVNFRGGANSRAGTKFVGFSKQTGRNFDPRLIPFQFNVSDALAIEAGNFYFRFISNGSFVTETPVAIGGASRANPCVLTFGASGAASATIDNTAVSFSYAPGDLVTLLGGTYLTPAVLSVTTSLLHSILPNAPGTGYAVNDTVTLAGGTFSVAAVAKVTAIASYAATGFITFSVQPNDGDTVTLDGTAWTFKTSGAAGNQTNIGLTLAATLAQLAIDLNASADANVLLASYASNTTQLLVTFKVAGVGGNAYTLAASVATRSGATLTGGTATGISTLSINTAGTFSALPAGGNMTSSATSGGGTGASFQTAVFGIRAVGVSNPGAYTVQPANPVAQASTDGIGLGATFTVTWAAVAAFNNGDWIEVSGIVGMTELNGNTYRVAGATATTVELLDVYGDPVDSTAFAAWVSGGTAARIYTLVTPYSEQDLDWIKFTESADVMTICCVNQLTGVEYAPQNLTRSSDTSWAFSDVVDGSSVSPPASLSASISGTGTTYYAYVVTAVSPVDGSESIRSAIAAIHGVSIATTQGQINLNWPAVADVQQYNIYKAQPSFGSAVPVGSLLGYIGSSYGVQFNDPNIFPDFSQVPPQHRNPFARGQIAAVSIVTGGSGYTSAPTATITTATGSGAVLETVIQGGQVVAVIVDDSGESYATTDTIALSGGGGVGATATLVVGPETGTYPSVPGYFQQRRVFGNSLDQPDTYWMSQPGSYNNFDVRIPPIASDAITGSPWAQQVNGLQFFVTTPGGLLVMTGLSAWLLTGSGSFATNAGPISPSSQNANPQPFTGCSSTIPPIKINYDVLYVIPNGSLYYDLPYQTYALSEPIDLTEYSTHLFKGFTVRSHSWCEQPFKTLWSVRSDGVMLSLTFLKAEQIIGWGRHDTNGLFVSNCQVTEPPVNALYVATKRYPGTHVAYMIERMDNRIWRSVEDVWAVDAGLSLPQEAPDAILSADSTYGIGNLTGVTDLVGGSGYSASTTASVVDDNDEGPGSGAVPVLTIIGGVITAVNFAPQGSGYVNPKLVIDDPENQHSSDTAADARITLNTTARFTASAAIFSAPDLGSVIRMGGGIGIVTAVLNTQTVEALMSVPITALRPNSGLVQPQNSGDWTITQPVMQVFGLGHLAGATVTGLGDGKVITPRVVSALGEIDLDEPASSIVLGLGFQAQLQSVYAEGGTPTQQGQRKKIAEVAALLEDSRGVQIGSNQQDGSALSPPQIAPQWFNLSDVPDQGEPGQPTRPYNSDTDPLFTCYVKIPVQGGFGKPGQVALEQDYPLPMNVIALVPGVLGGDTPGQAVPQRGGQQQ